MKQKNLSPQYLTSTSMWAENQLHCGQIWEGIGIRHQSVAAEEVLVKGGKSQGINRCDWIENISELVGQVFVCTIIWPWACGSLSHHCTCSAEDRVGMPVSIDWSATNDDELPWWATDESYRWSLHALWMRIISTIFLARLRSAIWHFGVYRVLVQSSIEWDNDMK